MRYRQLEEMMQERGVEVEHFRLNRWVLKFTPALDKTFRRRKRAVGTSWRLALALGHPVGQPLDETYIRVKGQKRPYAFCAKRSISRVCRKRSPSIRAAPIPPRLTITTPTMRPALNCEWLALGHRQSI